MAALRMIVWLVLCGLVYATYPDLAPDWAFVIAAALGLLALYGLSREREDANWVVIDGSNVMHWFDETPSLDTVSLVVNQLTAQGYEPIVWFDANVGYKVGTRYMGPQALSRKLPLDRSAIRVAPKGSPADPLLIEEAISIGARVVSNDKFRDWTEAYPVLKDEAFLIRAQVHATGLTMEIKPAGG